MDSSSESKSSQWREAQETGSPDGQTDRQVEERGCSSV